MALHKLTESFIRQDGLKPGRYSDGGNLYLNVTPKTKSWVFMYARNRQPRREMGLGPFPGMTLSMARDRALEARNLLEEGLDPLEYRRKRATHRYTVKGKWPFPYDMVRRDGSRPASVKDEENVARYSAEHAPDREVFKDVEIELVGPARPNVARWESFGWAVTWEPLLYRTYPAPVRPRSDDEIRKAALAKLSSEERRVLDL